MNLTKVRVPSTDKMPALEELDQRFRRREADQDIRVKVAAHAGLGRAFVDVPR